MGVTPPCVLSSFGRYCSLELIEQRGHHMTRALIGMSRKLPTYKYIRAG